MQWKLDRDENQKEIEVLYVPRANSVANVTLLIILKSGHSSAARDKTSLAQISFNVSRLAAYTNKLRYIVRRSILETRIAYLQIEL